MRPDDVRHAAVSELCSPGRRIEHVSHVTGGRVIATEAHIGVWRPPRAGVEKGSAHPLGIAGESFSLLRTSDVEPFGHDQPGYRPVVDRFEESVSVRFDEDLLVVRPDVQAAVVPVAPSHVEEEEVGVDPEILRALTTEFVERVNRGQVQKARSERPIRARNDEPDAVVPVEPGNRSRQLPTLSSILTSKDWSLSSLEVCTGPSYHARTRGSSWWNLLNAP